MSASALAFVSLAATAPACGAVGRSDNTSLPLCPRTAYRYTLGKNGAQGALILDAHVASAAGRRCRVDDRVVLRLTDGRGRLLRVRGNPVRTVMRAVVGRREILQTHAVLFAWRNWCSSFPASFAFTVSSRAKSGTFRWSVGEPACIDPAKPSTLRPFTAHG